MLDQLSGFFTQEENMQWLFKTANRAPLLVILPMLVLPGTRITHFILHSKVVLISLSILYSVLLFTLMAAPSSTLPKIDFLSFDSVANGFQHKPFVLVGWVHYLVTDPLVATLIYYDAISRGIPHVFTSICILFAFMLCPFGLALYIFGRLLLCRVWFEWFISPIPVSHSLLEIWFGSADFWRNMFCISSVPQKTATKIE